MTTDTAKCIVDLCAVNQVLLKLIRTLAVGNTALAKSDWESIKTAENTVASVKDMAQTPIALTQEGGFDALEEVR